MRYKILFLGILWMAGPLLALDKEISLLTGKSIGNLAVAGRLAIDLHAEFMMARTYENQTVLNWHNCGYSGGGAFNTVGGTFGNFGLDVPWQQRTAKYPVAALRGTNQVARFDGQKTLKANFAVDEALTGSAPLSIEIWFYDESPTAGQVLLGWQSPDGAQTSGAVAIPSGITGNSNPRHLVLTATQATQAWYLDGTKLSEGARTFAIAQGHIPVLGGAAFASPSFNGDLAAVRLHEGVLTGEEITNNVSGGVRLGTELHDWFGLEPDLYYFAESRGHFRHCVTHERNDSWTPTQRSEFLARVDAMFAMAELCHRTYTERLAMRSSVVSRRPAKRGDGIKYRCPIMDTDGSWMGVDDDFGWACQYAGHINPHELVHGYDAQTGGAMQGNFWEVHANFPQTYNGFYQSAPPDTVTRVANFFPGNGCDYYHDRSFFEHLAQTPMFGPMFVAKLWYDGATEKNPTPSPFNSFVRLNPYPSTAIQDEYMKMVIRNVTWDYQTFAEANPWTSGNTPFGNDGVPRSSNFYREVALNADAIIRRFARPCLQAVPYKTNTWRIPKESTPQQFGWNVCPLKATNGATQVGVKFTGYSNPLRGGGWGFALVGVDAASGMATSTIQKITSEGAIKLPSDATEYFLLAAKAPVNGVEVTFNLLPNKTNLYLVVAAIPSKIEEISMAGADASADFRSTEQETFPYEVTLSGCTPQQVVLISKPAVAGKIHSNGGGWKANTATVDASAYLATNAMVFGTAQVRGNARILDYAVVKDSAIVRDYAVVSGYATVENSAIVEGYAKVRDFGRVWGNGALIRGNARILERATQESTYCDDNLTAKGASYGYNYGSVSTNRGAAILDGLYAKGGVPVMNGKLFCWSWGFGLNAGESTNDFGGLYMDMQFNTPHAWMARDDHAATYGYLSEGAIIETLFDETTTNGVLTLNGDGQFVELQKDVADFRDMTIRLRVKPSLTNSIPILDFSNAANSSSRLRLGTDAQGRLLFSIMINNVTQSLTGSALPPNVWTALEVILNGDTATLKMNGSTVASSATFTHNPDGVEANRCAVGRAATGNSFAGQMDYLQIYSIAK